MLYTVIMPAHRPDRFLREAILSVEHEVERDDGELIVIANGPDRREVAALVGEAASSPKVRVVVSEIASLVYCLNRGIELASGEFIARMDSDDICLPGRFRMQYEIAVRNRVDFLFGAAEVIDQNGRDTGKQMRSTSTLSYRCGPIHPTAFLRRSALLTLGGYGNIEYSEDYYLWLRALAAGYVLQVDQAPVIKYRVHVGQLTDKGRIAETFATNVGIKLMVGLRACRPAFIAGAAVDFFKLAYRSCRNALSF